MNRSTFLCILTLAALLVLGGGAAFAQTPPAIQWEKSFGGSGVDEATCIQQTRDGGFIVAGTTTSTDGDVSSHHGSTDSTDCWIIKLDAIGNIVWKQNLGGGGNDAATCVRQTSDSGYIIAGYTNSTDGDVAGNHGGDDCWIIKLDFSGNVVWKKCYGGNDDDRALSIQQTTDNGYVFCGWSNSNDGDVSGHHGQTGNGDLAFQDFWIVKLDSVGTILWQRSLGGDKQDVATSIQQTSDKGYVVAGLSASSNGQVSGHHNSVDSATNDMWVVKLDSLGGITWNSSLGGSKLDQAYGVQQVSDGGYIVAGLTFSLDGDVSGYHGDGDYWLVKLDALGKLQWERALGGKDNEQAYGAQQTVDNGYIVAGFSASRDGDVTGNRGFSDYWIVKTNSVGGKQWQASLGGSGFDWANAIQQTSDSGYIVAGYSNSVDGDVTGNHGGYDFWIVKLAIAPPTIFSSQQELLPRLLCSDQAYDTVMLMNTGGKTLVVASASFDYPAAGFSLLSPALPDSIAPGDSLRYIIEFSPTATGTFSATLNINSNDPAHSPWPIAFSCRKERVGVAVSGAGNGRGGDTVNFGALLCGSTKDTTIALINTSTVSAIFALKTGANSLFQIPGSATLNAGAQEPIQIHFVGAAQGSFNDSLVITDACGLTTVVYLIANIVDANIAVSTIANAVVCIGDTTSASVSVHNYSGEPQTFQITGSAPLFSISQTVFTVAPGDSAVLVVAFHGAAGLGAYAVTYQFVDACGATHTISFTVNVQNPQPVLLSLAADVNATPVGQERKVFVVASPRPTGTSGTTAITARNELSALQFDSIHSSLNIVAVSGSDSVLLNITGGWSALTSDTIATLFYRTLVGSTLSPHVTLQNVQTSNTCNTVTSNQQPATINLLPPGCELGTVVVHPFTSSIQSIYPNPASGVTTVTYSTIEDATVRLRICDALGRTVQTLVNTVQKAGVYITSLNTQTLMNGMYYAEMRVGSFAQTREVLILR